MKNNQTGFSHIIVIAAVALVIGVVGFAAFRIGQSNEAKKNQQKEHPCAYVTYSKMGV